MVQINNSELAIFRKSIETFLHLSIYLYPKYFWEAQVGLLIFLGTTLFSHKK